MRQIFTSLTNSLGHFKSSFHCARKQLTILKILHITNQGLYCYRSITKKNLLILSANPSKITIFSSDTILSTFLICSFVNKSFPDLVRFSSDPDPVLNIRIRIRLQIRILLTVKFMYYLLLLEQNCCIFVQTANTLLHLMVKIKNNFNDCILDKVI